MATASPTKSTSSTSSLSAAAKSDSTTQEQASSQTTENIAQDSSEDLLDNPTRDTLAEGLIGLLTPSIEHLDQGIANCRSAQLELRDQLGALEAQLLAIDNELQGSVDLEPYVERLLNTKKKVIVVNSMLQASPFISSARCMEFNAPFPGCPRSAEQGAPKLPQRNSKQKDFTRTAASQQAIKLKWRTGTNEAACRLLPSLNTKSNDAGSLNTGLRSRTWPKS